MTSLKEAQEIVLSYAQETGGEEVPLASALGRVVKKDFYAPFDLPSFSRSAMDGFAVKVADLTGASPDQPVKLKLVDEVPAGYVSSKTITSGKTIKIMTGALIPQGAEAVIMVEDTKTEKDGILMFKSVRKNENISPAGEDVKKGELVLRKGSFIRPAELAILASFNCPKIEVAKKPVVSIISTGDELVPVGKELKEGQIRESNSFSLAGAVKLSGGEPKIIGIVKDNKKDLLEKINQGKEADIMLLSGGVSVGDYDIVKDVLVEDGIREIFWKVKIKPGKPIFFGVLNQTLIFGLPGYPLSSLITFEFLVRPAILKMLGRTQLHRRKIKAKLTEEIKRKPGRLEYQRASLTYQEGKYYVTPTSLQLSSALSSLVQADCLIELTPEVSAIKKGEPVEVILIDEK
jgi:molybdopterin molybdotransferase